MSLFSRSILVTLLLGSSVVWAQTQTPVPVEAFARYNTISMPRLSPDGQYLALTSDLGKGHYALNVFRLDDNVQTTQMRLPKWEIPIQVVWVDNERLVVGKGRLSGSIDKPVPTGVIVATDYDGKNQTYVYGPKQSTRTSGLDRGYGFIAGLPEQPNGNFYMRSYSYASKRSAIYEVDARKTTHREIASLNARDMSFVFRHDGTPAYAYGVDDDNNYLLHHSENGRKWRQLSADAVGGKLVPVAMSTDDDKVYAYFSKDGGPLSLVLAGPGGRQHTTLIEQDFASVDRLLYWFAPPTRPFGAFTGSGIPSVHYFDPEDPAAKLHAGLSQALPGLRVRFIDQTQDGDKILLHAWSDRDPGAWYLYRTSDSKLSKLLVSREGIDPQRMGERRPFRFETSDGLTLAGFMTLPPGVIQPAGLPTILLPHGGPHVEGDDWSFDTQSQFLASRGYLVLQINYRGSQGRGTNFEEAGYLKWGTRIQQDLIEGVQWAIEQGWTDSRRICAFGASFGAYSAMMVAAKAPGLLRCTVGYAGLYDLPMMYSKGDIREDRFGRNYLTRVIGRDNDALVANSPTTHAGEIKVPVLLIHGEADERTPFAQAKAMRTALENANNSPEWMSVPGEGHGFYDEDNTIAMYKRLEAFLARHLALPADGIDNEP